MSLWQWKRRLNLFGGWNLQRDFLFGLDDESNALLEGWEVMEVLDGLPRQLELALLLFACKRHHRELVLTGNAGMIQQYG